MEELDPEVIRNSQAIRAINHYIDTRLENLQHWELVIIDRMKRVVQRQEHYGYLATRVSYEGGRKEVDTVLSPSLLEDMSKSFKEFTQIYNEIDAMARYKLRLFNDIDFTHGDNLDQTAVFGNK